MLSRGVVPPDRISSGMITRMVRRANCGIEWGDRGEHDALFDYEYFECGTRMPVLREDFVRCALR
jgi:hypothetical protein